MLFKDWWNETNDGIVLRAQNINTYINSIGLDFTYEKSLMLYNFLGAKLHRLMWQEIIDSDDILDDYYEYQLTNVINHNIINVIKAYDYSMLSKNLEEGYTINTNAFNPIDNSIVEEKGEAYALSQNISKSFNKQDIAKRQLSLNIACDNIIEKIAKEYKQFLNCVEVF